MSFKEVFHESGWLRMLKNHSDLEYPLGLAWKISARSSLWFNTADLMLLQRERRG